MGSVVKSNDIDLNDEDESKCLSVEEAIQKLGGFSKFQFFLLIALGIEFASSMVSLNPILTGATNVDFYCENNGTNISSNYIISKNDLCNSNCTGRIVPLQIPPYKSVVQEWSLICNKAWFTETFTSVQMVGSTIGAIIVAYCADRYGRWKAFYISTFLLATSGFVCSLATDPYYFMAAKFFSGFTIGATFVAHFNYLMEFLPPSARQICGCISFWSMGEMTLGLFGYLSQSWRLLECLSSAPGFLLFLGVFIVPESPRWLLSQNKTEEAKVVFDKISHWNSRPQLTSEEINKLQKTVNAESESNNETKSYLLALKAFQNLRLFLTLITFIFAWFTNAVVYYGISFNMKNLTGDPYWNVFYLGLVDFGGTLSGFFQSNRFGRRRTFIANLLLSSFMLIPLVIIQLYYESDYPTLILVLCLVGKFFNEASWGVMACFTSESFPTVCRSFSLSLCSAASTLGGVFAPQLSSPLISKAVPYIVFAALSFTSSLVSLTLKEMKGKPLVDL